MQKLNPLNDLIGWINTIGKFFSEENIIIPNNFKDKVRLLKEALKNDISGLVNTVLNFMGNCMSRKYTIDTGNENLDDILNDLLAEVNAPLRGKEIQVGIEALAKQYAIERWNRSSLLLLRTFWEYKLINGEKWYVPTKMWFVDGASVDMGKEGEAVRIGEQDYKLQVSKDRRNDIRLPHAKNEIIFVQKPFEKWGTKYPNPWLFEKGIYQNLEMIRLLESKGEKLVAKAIEGLLLLKKGTERLAIEGKVRYSEKDLKDVNKAFKDFLDEKKSANGVSAYTTNFDTEIEQFIPEYSKIVKQELFIASERKILAGLGLIDIIQGITSTRKESTLIPIPLMNEINKGSDDFKAILKDIIATIKEQNPSHVKYNARKIKITSAPIQEFMTDKLRQELRLSFTYGKLSAQTYIEDVLNKDYEIEIDRRKKEIANGIDKILYAPVIQNQEDKGIDVRESDSLICECIKCGYKETLKEGEHFKDKKCPKCKGQMRRADRPGTGNPKNVDKNGNEIPSDKTDKNQKKNYDVSKVIEGAPYSKLADLPDNVKKLPRKYQSLWLRSWNSIYSKYGDESRAFKLAWYVVNRKRKKSKAKKK